MAAAPEPRRASLRDMWVLLLTLCDVFTTKLSFLQRRRSDSTPNKGARWMVLVFLIVMVCLMERTLVLSLPGTTCYFLSGATLLYAYSWQHHL